MSTHIRFDDGSSWPRPELEGDEEYGIGHRLRYARGLTSSERMAAAAVVDAVAGFVSAPKCECGSGVSRGECHPALTPAVPTETTVEIGGQVMTESQYNAAQFPYKHAPGRVSPASTGDDEAARAVYAAQYPDAPEMFDHPELKRERNLARRLAAAALSVGRVSPVVYEYATEYFHKGKPGYAGIMCDLERAKSWTRNQKQNDLNVSTVCRIKAVPASEWEPVGVEK